MISFSFFLFSPNSFFFFKLEDGGAIFCFPPADVKEQIGIWLLAMDGGLTPAKRVTVRGRSERIRSRPLSPRLLQIIVIINPGKGSDAGRIRGNSQGRSFFVGCCSRLMVAAYCGAQQHSLAGLKRGKSCPRTAVLRPLQLINTG